MKKKKRMIALDADPLIFEATEGKFTKANFFKSEAGEANGKKYKEPLKPYKQKIKRAIADIEDEISAALPGEVKGIKAFFSDPDSNFRYDIYPEYKANRKSGSRSELFYRLRKWVMKKYGCIPNVEADDVVAHYVRKGWIGSTFDKDLLYGVPGTWFDTHYSRRHILHTSELQARQFNLTQTLAGDSVDNIKGIPGVGHPTAVKLLDKYGWDWNGVVAAYKEKGLTEKDAILSRRLICLDQWTPKKGVKLWKPKKK
jgi:DNA polymerase-1